jgi:uncharacterized membrane protein
MEKLRSLWSDLQGSLWFLPALIVAAAVTLAGAMVWVDASYQFHLDRRWPLVFGAGAEGSRGVLAAIASSVITVAGVVFSITIVALSLAASQYSPRVLRNFMRDRPTQWVLGMFVGIFAYCIVVLRTIRGQSDADPFVPSLAVLVGIALALVAIGFFVYFIHHVAASIQAASILSRVQGETVRVIDRLYPDTAAADASEDAPPILPDDARSWLPLAANRTGYIVRVDFAGLAALARRRQVRLRLQAGVGAFVVEGQSLARATGAARVDDDLAREVSALYVINAQRSVDQDVTFGIQQIVDVALKALSTGMNDTTTAVMCVDHLTAVLARLVTRRIGPPSQASGDGVLIDDCGPSFASLLAAAFEPIRRSAAGNPVVLSRLVSSAAVVAAIAANDHRRALLALQLQATVRAAQATIDVDADRAALVAQGEDALVSLLGARETAPGAAPIVKS